MPTHQELANAIRALSIDAIEKSQSGHPGMPMGMADIAETLWNDFLQHNPNNPHWINRDRFVLSNGHGSMLLYSLLHLSGYDVSLDDLQRFRQLDSITPGHPEVDVTPGVETTTGPLGQGLANAVGMALAETHLAAEFNRDHHQIIDHFTYAFAGDGCLMEGISHEACSLAGTLKLGKLIVLYDDNHISIDGDTKDWFTDNTPERFRAYGWHVVAEVDGHNHEAISQAITEAQAVTDKPSLICCQTIIGKGAPNIAGTAATHGSPLGADEIAATRKAIAWPHDPFVIPEEIAQSWSAKTSGQKLEEDWQKDFDEYSANYPELASELLRRLQGAMPEDWQTHIDELLTQANADKQPLATRKSSQFCLNTLGPYLPEIMGGSADLAGSTGTRWKDSVSYLATQPQGRFVLYGVREFGMSAIMNGMALYGGIIPYSGTFLTFSDYARNAIRMAALMHLRCIFVYTHDSVCVGEDGPTHQPIEQLASLRLIPNVIAWRPCDTVETIIAWQNAIERQGPSCLILSRQNLTQQPHDQFDDIHRGGYILQDCAQTPEIILMASGSEVDLTVQAAKQLSEKGHQVRVVSIPSLKTFLAQDETYRQHVIPTTIKKRIAVEAGCPDSWYRLVGDEGHVLGIEHFGTSAPGDVVLTTCGMSVENILALANK